MTAKEAIYILRNAAWLGSDADRQKVEEAVEVVARAIEALNNSEIPNSFGKDTNVPSNDTISRQAAIDLIKNDAFWVQYAWGGRGHKPEMEMVDDLVESIIKQMKESVMSRLKQMPSVQPERTCVNCGRTVNNGGWYADGGTRCPIEEHYALPKDGYCHLWEKRNFTDDDYPERREE